MRSFHVGLAGAALAGGLAISGAASAGTITFNLGEIVSDGGAVCASACVIAGVGQHTFSDSGYVLGAIGYNGDASEGGSATAPIQAYVTQKPGKTGSGETGLGESNTYPNTSDSDYEIKTNTYLLLSDLTPHTSVSSLEIELIENGEGANIYG